VANARTVQDVQGRPLELAATRSAISGMPVRLLSDVEAERVRHGQAITSQSDAPVVALVDSAGELMGVGERQKDHVHPRVVLQHEL
jgi:hypothetical protein